MNHSDNEEPVCRACSLFLFLLKKSSLDLLVILNLFHTFVTFGLFARQNRMSGDIWIRRYMKRVLYDSSAFDMQTHGGVSRCFAELYTRLPENISARIGVIETNNVYLQQLGFNTSGYLYGQFAGKGNFLGKKALYKLYYRFYYHH